MYVANIPKPEKRISDYERLGYGMFVHFGLFSQIGDGEWAFWMTDRNMDKYAKLADTFTAEDFDAREIAKTAKEAGCKYVCMTTRHHEGFSLYDTRGLSDFDSIHACGRDLVREYVDACREFDLVPFLYHTTLDWYQKSFNDDFDTYLEYLRASVEILCRNYGKIGGLFFDGNWSKPKADWKLDDLYGTIRKYQPDAIIINNTGLHQRGKMEHPEIDAVTFEQGGVSLIDRDGAKKYVAAEVCMTMNRHWGIAYKDFNYKSPAEIITELCRARTCGANLLMNIGPGAQGAIDPFQKATMLYVGKWVEIFKEALYDVTPLIYPDDPHCIADVKILSSTKEKAYYFFNFSLGEKGHKDVTVDGRYSGVIGFTNVKAKIKRIEWLDSGEELAFTQNDDGILSVDFKGYKYGTDYVVRVAKAYLE